MNKKILIAEDEPELQKIMKLYLEQDGHLVTTAANGEEALEHLYERSFDLLVTDWMMPVMSGLELCKEIRLMGWPVKIIMLTAKSNTADEIAGLTVGADDYIKKPFEPQLLLLRIRKLFRTESQLTCGAVVLNTETYTVYVGGDEVRLTPKEWQLLEYLMRNIGRTMSRDRLIELVWGTEYEGDERTLDTHIRRLRNKIGAGYIKTFVGIGYRMDEPHE